MTKTVVTLKDRYEQQSGGIFLSSMQALVRLPVDQARRDRAAGLRTGGYVTGYRGSPITTLDAQLWSSKTLLAAHDIHFEPGLNEELAATSLRGTQQLEWFGKPRVEGVFAMWYAKGLGVDRAIEALKIANFEGTHGQGGVLVNAGDDPAAKSSATAHQSEQTLIAGFLPVLMPATTDEILAYGQLGWAMSRFSGLYVAMKTVTDGLDLTSSVTLPDIGIVLPDLRGAPSLNIRRGLSANQQEALVVNDRLPAATLFAAANGFNRIDVEGGPAPRLTIVTAGKAWLDVRQALLDLGFDARRCAAVGLRVVKLGMVWPLDRDFLRAACGTSREVLVVEEKRPLVEDQLAAALYAMAAERPAITGKRDDRDRPLLPSDGVLNATSVRRAIVRRLEATGGLDGPVRERAERLEELERRAISPVVALRPAFFCSGCPHNTSTRVPDGSVALGATGCHGLAVTMPDRNTMTFVGMGAEGTPWIGAQHFTETRHMFANMGDGTYTHSGLLAIRAAHAAGANVTFKILYNDAVAMTGGQPLEGGLTPAQIVAELIAEGVKPVVLVSDEPSGAHAGTLPAGTRVLHRDELDRVQRELREIEGVSAIVYEQTCANEKRRRRKRGTYPDPDLRLYINPAVCEGCGDCSHQSNCVSIQPLDTEFGRKRRIDQSNCNKDYSCLKGYCPSFVTVRGASLAKKKLDTSGLRSWIERLPDPSVIEAGEGYSMLVTGIGGTGVLTVGAILGMAAHMEGKAAKVLDMTGMAQKGGGVMSHVRFADDVATIPSARLGTGQADLLIACDLIVASGPAVTGMLRPATRVVANQDVVPTGEFQTRGDVDLTARRFLPSIDARVAPGNVAAVRANELAQALMGDTIFANLMMVGVAAQFGLMPVTLASIEEAVRLNGTAVEANLQALTLGRIAACFPDDLLRFAGFGDERRAFPQTLAAMIETRAEHLEAYQNRTHAQRYRSFLGEIEARLAARGVEAAEPLLMAVAEQLARLMTYKDEYEVARLYSLPEFREGLRRQFTGDFRLSLNLGSPYLSMGKDRKTGRPKKVEVGSWVFSMFRGLAALKRLRGTPFDLFGYAAERRMERALIDEYRALVRSLVDTVTPASLPTATAAADAARLINGYGPVKEAGVRAWRETVAGLRSECDGSQAAGRTGAPVRQATA